VEAWLGGEAVERFWIRSLDAFCALAGKDVRIVVNELVQWWLYEREPAVGAASLGGLVDAICSLKAKLGARLLYLVHDYYCVCPRFTLLAPDCRYCGSEVSCGRCGRCLQSREAAPCAIADGTSIAAWRDAFGRLLRACDEVRTFSEDSRRRVEACYPGLALSCTPHELPQAFPPVSGAPREELVIGVFGNIHLAKGSREVLALARHLEAEGVKSARIVVAGGLETDGERLPGNVRVLGPYRHEDMPAIVERENMAVSFFPSVCPETFSFVVHELIALGLPLVCYNLGAQKDAVAAYRRGSVVDGFSPEATWAAIRAAVPDL
jgi:glycosyltransferase involved in cell wall biosynthesis